MTCVYDAPRRLVWEGIPSDTKIGPAGWRFVLGGSSVDTGEVTDDVLTGNTPPQLVVDGMNFTIGGNQIR